MYTYMYIYKYVYIFVYVSNYMHKVMFRGYTHKYISHGWTFITKFHLEKSQPKKGNLSSSSTRRKGSAVVQAQFTPKSTCHGIVFAPRLCFLLFFPWIFCLVKQSEFCTGLWLPFFLAKTLSIWMILEHVSQTRTTS